MFAQRVSHARRAAVAALLLLRSSEIAAQSGAPVALPQPVEAEATVLLAERLLPSAPSPLLPAIQRAQDPAQISFPYVVGGTVLGGVLGAGALAGTGALLGSSAGSDGYVSSSSVFAVLGAAVGYPIGAAIGARWAASTAEHKPSIGGILLASLAGAAVGGLVWNRIGESFESDREVADYTSWYSGAAVGVATHVLITSLVAHRVGKKAQRGAGRR